MINAGLREYAPDKPPKEVAKLAKEIKKEARKDIPSSEQLRQYYRYKFEGIGYTTTEVAELMAKIEEHIQVRKQKFGIE